MIFSLVACGTKDEAGTNDVTKAPTMAPTEESTVAPTAVPTTEETTDGFEIALITDKGNIDDKSFNQGSWEGVVKFATDNNITNKYYKPEEASDAGYLAAIDLAVTGGAKVVVTPANAATTIPSNNIICAFIPVP